MLTSLQKAKVYYSRGGPHCRPNVGLQLYDRTLEIDKSEALKSNKGKLKAKMVLSPQSREDLLWLIKSIEGSKDPFLSVILTYLYTQMPHLKGGGHTMLTKQQVVDGIWLSHNIILMSWRCKLHSLP